LNRVYTRLDILINNAAQTIRRPSAFYAHLMAFEFLPLPELPKKIQPLLKDYLLTSKPMLPTAVASLNPVTNLVTEAPGNWSIQDTSLGMNLSAALSQVPLLPEDYQHDVNLLPLGVYDGDRQQIDKRTHNSWRMKLDEVSTIELLEVYLINAVVPFMLCSKLKPLMMQSPSPSKYIINVTAMEGVFNYVNKQSYHPHTNMAKAALNMMTRTSARDYAQDNIFMNSVDTGWITNENPYPIAKEMEGQGFQPPLDAKDGAARIYDPIYVGIKTGKNQYGKLLKNYQVSDW
jgi:NAD(P)-dependent dehydrogenase (short-subunit alcohol dehydrogenase family)